MRLYFIPAIVLALTLAGCGSSHQYQINADSLDLYLTRRNVQEVYFASSLDGFQLHQTEKRGASTWKATLPSNRAFTYFYIIDGEFFTPSCKLKQLDDFGSKNCVYVPGL